MSSCLPPFLGSIFTTTHMHFAHIKRKKKKEKEKREEGREREEEEEEGGGTGAREARKEELWEEAGACVLHAWACSGTACMQRTGQTLPAETWAFPHTQQW